VENPREKLRKKNRVVLKPPPNAGIRNLIYNLIEKKGKEFPGGLQAQRTMGEAGKKKGVAICCGGTFPTSIPNTPWLAGGGG